MTATLSIRRATDADVEAAVDVWQRARWDARQAHLAARIDFDAQKDLDHFRAVVMREDEVWLAVDRDEVVGLLAMAGPRIHQLHVRPDRQRSGIGTALMAHARVCSPAGLRLHTFQGNAQSRRFYERHGFRATRFGISPAPECEPDVEYAWTPDAPPRG